MRIKVSACASLFLILYLLDSSSLLSMLSSPLLSIISFTVNLHPYHTSHLQPGPKPSAQSIPSRSNHIQIKSHRLQHPTKDRPMAAAARMMSLAREELPVVATELAATARASTTAAVESGASVAVRAGEKEVMNPVAIRHMAEMSVREAGTLPLDPLLIFTSLLKMLIRLCRSGIEQYTRSTPLHHPLGTTAPSSWTRPDDIVTRNPVDDGRDHPYQSHQHYRHHHHKHVGHCPDARAGHGGQYQGSDLECGPDGRRGSGRRAGRYCKSNAGGPRRECGGSQARPDCLAPDPSSRSLSIDAHSGYLSCSQTL